MKIRTTKNKNITTLLRFMTLFLLVMSSQQVRAQEILVVDSSKVQLNGLLNVSGNATINNALIGNLWPDDASDWTGFIHKKLENDSKKAYGFAQIKDGTKTYLNIKSGKGFIGFRVDNVNKMVILDNGNVGIGTDVPTSLLHLNGNATINNALIGNLGHGWQWAGFGHKDLKGARGSYALFQKNDGKETLINTKGNGGYISFRVDNISKMSIRDNGNVGIGTDAPTSLLHVNGNATINNALVGDLGHGAKWAGFGHKDLKGAMNKYALFQNSSGEETRLNTGAGGYISLAVENEDKLIIRGNGNVGIGIGYPEAPLHVKAINNTYRYGGEVRALDIHYNNVISGSYTRYHGSKGLSIIAEGLIISKSSILSQSDIRVKKNLRSTSTSADLISLKAIEIVDFQKIDTIADNAKYKKVIAQQVQKVYPLAVREVMQDFIPSVFQTTQSIDKVRDNEYRLSVANPHDLTVSDQVELKCYPGNTSERVKVTRIISPTQFEIQSSKDINAFEYVFVYGKQVNDLLSVDYDAISMLNVSATQEIAKQVEALQTENQSLTKRITVLEKQVKEMESLKLTMAQLQLLMQNSSVSTSGIEQSKK